jgi:hypothetical protein
MEGLVRFSDLMSELNRTLRSLIKALQTLVDALERDLTTAVKTVTVLLEEDLAEAIEDDFVDELVDAGRAMRRQFNQVRQLVGFDAAQRGGVDRSLRELQTGPGRLGDQSRLDFGQSRLGSGRDQPSIIVNGFVGSELQLAAEIDRLLTRRNKTSNLGF